MVQIKVVYLYCRRYKLKVGLPTSNDLIKKNPSQMYAAAWALVNSIRSQVDNQVNISIKSANP